MKTFNYFRSCKHTEKPINTDWITSGSLGSRDAVLVFRTSILNTKAKTTFAETYQDSSYHPVSIDSKSIENVSSSKDALPSTSRTTDFLKESFGNDRTFHLLSEEEKKNLARAPKNVVRIVTSEKKLCDSLSSSDYSISSEGDELDEIEKEVVKESVSITDVETTEDPDPLGDGENDDECKLLDEFDEYSPAVGMPAVDLKLTYKFVQTETKLLRKIFARHGLTEADENENFSIMWTGVHMKPDILRNLAPYQRVNHFPR